MNSFTINYLEEKEHFREIFFTSLFLLTVKFCQKYVSLLICSWSNKKCPIGVKFWKLRGKQSVFLMFTCFMRDFRISVNILQIHFFHIFLILQMLFFLIVSVAVIVFLVLVANYTSNNCKVTLLLINRYCNNFSNFKKF